MKTKITLKKHIQLKKLLQVSLHCCLLLVGSLLCYEPILACMQIPVSLEERVEKSPTVILGKLTDQYSYWDAKKQNIYTLNIIEVTAYLKGNSSATQVGIITAGGMVGDRAQIVTPSLKINNRDEYMFFLEADNHIIDYKNMRKIAPNLLQAKAYASTQGAIIKQFGHYQDIFGLHNVEEKDMFDMVQHITKEPIQKADCTPFAARPYQERKVTKGNMKVMPITNITPNPTNAGTVETSDFVTITGSGFGAESNVFYANADDGGNSLTASGVDSDNISWSDTEVRNKVAKAAGTGTVQVNGQQANITINYAHLNINDSFNGFNEVTRQRYYLVDLDGSGGYTYTYNQDFAANAAAVASFERALETWRCATFINFSVDKENTTTVNVADGSDNINVVRFGNLSAGVLGVAASNFVSSGNGSCLRENGIWHVNGIDITFQPTSSVNWNFSTNNPSNGQSDFESVALHELGHAHGLGHVIDDGAVMHFSITQGETARVLSQNDIDGGNAKMAYSANASAYCFTPGGTNGHMKLLNTGTCSLSGGSCTTPVANAGLDKVIDCTNTTVQLDGTGSTANRTYTWSGPGIVSGGNTQTPTVNQAGTYTIEVADGACTATDDVVVTSDTTPPTASAGVDKTIDCTNTTVQLDGTGSTDGATYQWTGPGTITNGDTETPTVNATGTYTILVTAVNGCTASDEVEVTGDTTPPTASAGVDKTINCTNTSVQLDGTGSTDGATYQWTGPGTITDGNTETPTVNTAGTYTILVTAANGCTASDEVEVTEDITPPTASAGVDKTIDCTNTSVQLDGTGSTDGATYQWTGPSTITNGDTETPTVNAVGTYTILVTAANGCTASDDVEVTSDADLPTASAGTDKVIDCTNTSVQLDGTGSTDGATYQWTGPGTITDGNTETPTVNTAGTYTILVTAVNGCTASDDVEVTEDITPPTASAGVDKTIDCTNTSVQLDGTGSTDGATYQWTGPGTITNGDTETPTVNTAGTYTILVTTANGCTATDDVEVTGDITPPIANAGSDRTIDCTNTSVQLDGTGSTDGATYQWTGPGTIVNGNTETPTVNAVGTYTILVTAANGCTASDDVEVTSDADLPIASAGVDKTIDCTNTSVQLDGTGSTDGATYQWTGPGTIVNGNTETPTVNAVGTYTILVTAVNGCTATDDVEVTSDADLPTANAGLDKVIDCTNTTVQLDGTGSTDGATYQWTGPGTITNDDTQTPTVNTAGTYTILVTAVNGCTASDNVVVTEDVTIPTINAGDDVVLTCDDSFPITLNAVSNDNSATYQWTGPGISSSANMSSITIDLSGDYTVVVTGSNGCTNSDIVTVSQDASVPTINAGDDVVLTCDDSFPITLNAVSNDNSATYQWTGPGISSSANMSSITVDVVGDYTVVVTGSNGCTNSDIVTISQDANVPTIDAGENIILGCDDSFPVTLNSISNDNSATYQWTGPGISSSANMSSITVDVVGDYTVVVTGSNGCTNSDIIIVSQDINVPMIDAGEDITLGCDDSFPITLSAVSDDVNATYQWTGPGIVSASNMASITIDLTGDYVVVITGANGCTNRDEVEVDQTASIPTANAGVDTTFPCEDDVITLDGTASSNGNDFEYVWTGPGNIINGNTLTPMVDAPGIYTLMITNILTDCTASDEVFVEALACCKLVAGKVRLVSGSLCSGDDVMLTTEQTESTQDFSQSILLVDPTTNQIIDIEDNTFASLPDADYIVYNYVAATLDAPSTPPTIGSTIADISDDGCYSLSAPFEFTMPQAFQTLSDPVNADNGSGNTFGSISPFKVNTTFIELEGGNVPRDFIWETNGLIFYEVDGDIATILYADNATWGLTVTGTNDCGVTSSATYGNEGENDGRLDLVNIDRTYDVCSTRTIEEGSVTLTIEGGVPPYTYTINSLTNNEQSTTTNSKTVTFEGLKRGWQYMTITDSGNPQQVTENSIWMPCVQRQSQISINEGRPKTINPSAINSELTVYPNPFSEFTTIAFTLPTSTYVSIEIFDVSGKLVQTVLDKEWMTDQQLHELTIAANKLNEGMYLLRLTTENGMMSHQKLMITK